MDKHQKEAVRQQAAAVIDKLLKNNMQGYYVDSAADVPAQVAQLLHEGDMVAVGGSMTLEQCGVLSLLREGKYRFLDRYASGLTPEQVQKIYRASFDADAYLCSANAVTMQGELYNVDGNSNRVAAICYGPRSVILVVGCNKIVPDIPSAIARVKQHAAPANAVRLSCETYCAKTGVCKGLSGDMTDGCASSARICCSYVVSAHQRIPGRIKVILVGEPLGY